MFDFSFINRIIDSFNSTRVVGIATNSIPSILGVVDYLFFEDFQLCYYPPPEKKDMYKGVIYFYRIDDQLYCTSKELEQDIPILPEYLNNVAFKQLQESLADNDNIVDKMDAAGKDELYQFLQMNKINLGLKYSWHKNISMPYSKLEDYVVNKFPQVVQVYQSSKTIVKKCLAFATSQTGFRIATFLTFVTAAVMSGGTVPALMCAAYAVSVGVSIIQQTVNKLYVNRLSEEAQLLEKYVANLSKQSQLRESNLVTPIVLNKKSAENNANKSKSGPIREWLSATAQHLSMSFLEVSVPLVAALISPVSAAVNLVEFVIYSGSAIATLGIGVYFQKYFQDQKKELREAIVKVKSETFIPEYNNLQELREIVFQQEKEIQALEVMESKGLTGDVAFKEQLKENNDKCNHPSILQEYSRALYQTVNPFDSGNSIKNARAFASSIAKAAASVTFALFAFKNNDLSSASVLSTGIGASIATINFAPRNPVCNNKPAISSENINQIKKTLEANNIPKDKNHSKISYVEKLQNQERNNIGKECLR
jgi:hypothetical protein